MRHRLRTLLLVALTAATLTSAPSAHAGPKDSWSQTHTAPYGFADFWEYVRCGSDASCSLDGSADAQTGRVMTDSQYSRSGAVPPDAELVQGTALQQFRADVPQRATRATATFTWRVHEATVGASSEGGELVSAAWFTAEVPACRGCDVQDGDTSVLAVNSSNGVPSSRTVTETTYTVTTTVSGKLPRDLLLRSSARSTVYSPSGDGLCPPELCPDPKRSGSAHVEATLLGVQVEFAP